MEPALTVEQLTQLSSPAFWNRYLSAVAVASLVYDHIRTLETEITDVWVSLGVSKGIKIIFLLGRYAADVGLLYSAYALSGGAEHLDMKVRLRAVLSIASCEIWVGTFWAAEALCIASIQGVVICRLKEVLGRKKVWLDIIPVLLFSIALIMIGLEMPQYYSALTYVNQWHICATHPLTPVFTLVQYSSLAFTDVIIILTFVAAVLEIPYKHSSEVIKKLERDGGWYFVGLFLIHATNIIVLSRGGNYFPIALPLGWSFTMIINSRIFHRIGLDKQRDDAATGMVVSNQHQMLRLA